MQTPMYEYIYAFFSVIPRFILPAAPFLTPVKHEYCSTIEVTDRFDGSEVSLYDTWPPSKTLPSNSPTQTLTQPKLNAYEKFGTNVFDSTLHHHYQIR